MPIFGEYETFGEPIATVEERGHLTTVWQARKAGASAGPLFVIKVYAPRVRKPKDPLAEDELDEDRGLQFLEGIKEQKKAQSGGGKCLAPIHAFGMTPEGVWYVTDFYPRNNLKTWIARRGGVDSAALRHVVHSVVTGCLALKRSRGHSHGNLKTANVFLVGKPRPLVKTPLHLTDPYPAAPLQLSNMDATDRKTVGDLLGQVVEIQDLKAIGELILQLVEGRLVTNAYDYNYPIGPSKPWEAVGDQWRQRCNRLLDPQLSLEKENLEALEKEFRPPLVTSRQLIVTVSVIVLMAAGIYFGIASHKQKVKQREEAARAQALILTQNFDKSMETGNGLMEQTNYPQAVIEFQNAVKSAAELKDPEKQKRADEAVRYASAIAQAQSAARPEDEVSALQEAAKIKREPRIEAWLSDATLRRDRLIKQRIATQGRADLDSAMAKGNSLLNQGNYAQAAVEFQKAMKVGGDLNDKASVKAADEGQRYASALAQAESATGVDDEIKWLGEALRLRQDPGVSARLDKARQRKQQGEVARTQAQQIADLDAAIATGNALMAQSNFAQARVEFQKAGKLAGDLKDVEKQKTADENQRFASVLAQAMSAGRVEEQIKFLGDALKIRNDPKVQAWLADAQKSQKQAAQTSAIAQQKADLTQATDEGNRLMGQADYAAAAFEFQKAVKIAGDLGDAEKRRTADESQRFATALAKAKTAKAGGSIDEEIQSLDAALKIRREARVDTWLVEARRRKDQIKALDTSLAEGNRLLDQTNYAKAIDEFQKAGKLAGDLSDPVKQKLADDGKLFATLLTQTKTASKEEEIKLLKDALKIRKDLKVEARLLAAQRQQPPGPVPAGTYPARTNLLGIDFAWVPGVRGSGAYVALTELSHAQFRAAYDRMNLNGAAQWQAIVQNPSSPLTQFAGTDDGQPMTLRQEQAAELVSNMNKQTKFGKFALPTLADFLIFAQVGPNLVDPTTGKFLASGAAVKAFGDEKVFWTGIGVVQRQPRGVKEGPANGYGLFNAIGNAWEWSSEQGAALGLAASSSGYGPSATLKRPFLKVSECISARLMFIPGSS